jgi:polysaccharide export outer membrane protein
MFRLKAKWTVLLCLIGSAVALAAEKNLQRPPAADIDPPEYRIGSGDVLQIDVWKEPDASSTGVTVRPDGRISLQMIGDVRVAGQTPTELEGVLAQRFEKFIRGARVTVTVREANSHRVYVIGEVRREGAIRLVTPITVLQALAEAGGITDYAKRKNIYILRVVDGRQASLRFDYDAVVRGQKVQQNVMLLSGDTIVVPR